MLRDVKLEEISDGKLYGANDLVKADCHDCAGCCDCCCGMGESILLDPSGWGFPLNSFWKRIWSCMSRTA